MRKVFFILLTSFTFSSACKDKNIIETHAKYEIDLESNIKHLKKVPLSICGKKLEYIPLETSPASVLSNIDKILLVDSIIFVSDGARLLEFSQEGKFVRQIGKRGRGPGEYINIRDFCVDEINKLIYVCSTRNRSVLVYKFNGDLERTFKSPEATGQILIKDSNSLMFHLINISRPTTKTIYSWIVTDKEGANKEKIRNNLKRVSFPGITVPKSPFYIFENTPHFMEFGIDTLYSFVRNTIRPYAVFILGSMKMNPDPLVSNAQIYNELQDKIWISSILEDFRYIYFTINWGLSDSTNLGIFDKMNSEIAMIEGNNLVNDLNGGPDFQPKQIYKDSILIGYVQSYTMLQYLNKFKIGQLSEELGGLKQKITETSNPILMKVKR